MFTLEDAARLAGGTLVSGNPRLVVADFAKVTIDSRTVRSGDLFVALSGSRSDGHQFAPRAIASGAAGVMISDVECLQALPPKSGAIMVPDTEEGLQALARGYRQRYPVPLAAITGSCGKTTTKEMVRAILEAAGTPLVTEGNLNNHLGLPLTLLELRPNHDRCVVEMGINHTGEMDLLCGIADPAIGLITGVGDAHLEGLGSRQGVADEKGRLFAHVAKDGTAVVNLDDELVAAQAEKYAPARTVTYSVTPGTTADVTAALNPSEAPSGGPDSPDGDGVPLRLTIGGVRHATRLCSRAPYQVRNACAAAALAHAMGVAAEAICEGLAAFNPPPMRGREYLTPEGARVIDDSYNANPDSMRAAVAALMATPSEGRRIACLGDMLELGEDAADLHHALGEEIARMGPDLLLCVGELARHMAAGAAAMAHVKTAGTATDAASLLGSPEPGDLILVKGSRGMAMEKLVAALAPAALDETEVPA